MKNKKIAFMALVLLLLPMSFAVPDTLNLMGKLTSSSGSYLTGTYLFNFSIYDAPEAGNRLYQYKVNLTTDSHGVYDVIFENVNLNFSDQYYLGIQVGDDEESTPRINLTTSPYAFRANISEDLNPLNRYKVSVLNVTGNLTVGDSILFVDGSSGFVGIGMTAPNYRLDVLGDINATNLDLTGYLNASSLMAATLNVTSTATISSALDTALTVSGGITAAGGAFDLTAAGAIADVGAITSDGVITTTSAASNALDITGGIDLEGSVQLGSDGADTFALTSVGTNITTGGAITTAGAIESASLTSLGQIITDTITVGGGFGSSGLTIGADGTIRTDGDFWFSGNMTVLDTEHLKVNGSFYPGLDDTYDIGNGSLRWKDMYLVGMNYTSGNLDVDGGVLYVDAAGDKVGIGTTDPQAVLHVAGSAVINGTALTLTGELVYDTSANYYKYYNGTDWVQTGSGSVSGSGWWTKAGNDVYYNTGNVGIGTASPTAELQIDADDPEIKLH